MSILEEDIVVAPWVGPTSCTNALSVVVLSNSIEIIEKISEALSAVHYKRNFPWRLIVLRSFQLQDIVKQSDITGKIGIDFVVLAIDTSKLFCLEWVKRVLAQIHPDLRCRRVVLVNAASLPANSMAINAGDLIALSTEMKLDIITADVFDEDGVSFLAQRLLQYIEVTIGIKTGIPNLNV